MNEITNIIGKRTTEVGINYPSLAGCSKFVRTLKNNKNFFSHQDFFSQSAPDLLAGIIWLLSRYEEGRCCDWVHVGLIFYSSPDKIYNFLRADPEVKIFVKPFMNACENGANRMVERMLKEVRDELSKIIDDMGNDNFFNDLF